MKLVETEFKSFCTKTFGDEWGDKVYKFYRNLYFPSGNDFFARKKSATITQKRIKNITYLLEKYGREAFIEGIIRHAEANKSGVLPTLSVLYFAKIVENVAKEQQSLKQQVKVKQEPLLQKTSTHIVIPKKGLLVRQDYEEDFYNYSYICECGNEVNPWQNTCPYCKATFDWQSVSISSKTQLNK